MEFFVDTINHCGFRDVGFIGPKFTWLYQRANGVQICERLDGTLASPNWLDLFPTAKLHHLSSSASDHSPLSLHLVQRKKKKKVRRTFRFESMWLKDSKCEEVVKAAWEGGLLSTTDWVLGNCLERCRSDLAAWNKAEFGHIGRKISEPQTRLEWLELQPSTPDLIHAMKSTRLDLNCSLEKEDEMWRQRSRLNWFQAGDRNTSFFHAKALTRYTKNYMEGLFDANGVWQEDETKMVEIVVHYYNNLFTSNNLNDFTKLLNVVQLKVSTSMNEEMTQNFTENEVRLALKQMYPLKAPGPDGVPPLFFQHFWSTSGVVVTKMELDFLNHGISPHNFNKTHIVLIPRVKEPKQVFDYRPISLCNVVYKIASKVITNRLKKILPSIISEA